MNTEMVMISCAAVFMDPRHSARSALQPRTTIR